MLRKFVIWSALLFAAGNCLAACSTIKVYVDEQGAFQIVNNQFVPVNGIKWYVQTCKSISANGTDAGTLECYGEYPDLPGWQLTGFARTCINYNGQQVVTNGNCPGFDDWYSIDETTTYCDCVSGSSGGGGGGDDGGGGGNSGG